MPDRHPSDSPDVVALDPIESLSIFLLLREGPLHGRELDEAMAEREAFEELRRALTQLHEERERLTRQVDPHHAEIEWKLSRGDYYQRHAGQSKWTRVERIHATQKRVAALARLSDDASTSSPSSLPREGANG